MPRAGTYKKGGPVSAESDARKAKGTGLEICPDRRASEAADETDPQGFEFAPPSSAECVPRSLSRHSTRSEHLSMGFDL